MDPQNFSTFTAFLDECVVIFIFMATLASQTLSLDPKFEACEPKRCGNGPSISYPFWISGQQQSYCGYPNFGIGCKNQNPVLNISNDDYIIKDIFYDNSSLLVANSAAYGDTCPTPPHNLTLDRAPFNSSDNVNLLFLYNCSERPSDYAYPISCASNSYFVFHEYFLWNESKPLDSCKSFVYAPVDLLYLGDEANLFHMNYTEVLKMGFLLNWTAHNCTRCSASGGRCGFYNNEFVCFCTDKPHHKTCDDDVHKRDYVLKVIIGLCATALGMFIMGTVAFVYIRRNKKKNAPSSYVSRSTYSGSSSGLDIEKGDDFHGLQVFTYNELEVATHYFDSAKELGDGGFGTVYHGKLRDGRAVAVKRLYENNCRRFEQFRNEIEILARLRHQNLVSLYGCTSRHSRELLLVYEYIPNGTVADHLHGERAKPGALPWHIRLKIAIETANALKYLHASDIIHRDVKTDNILLDKHFCVKVADFGLSRLFPTNVTHVSTAPQGTPGYVDPEYHQCYQLTDKSDVFSFGVVMIELISSMPAVDITRHRHEINLSNMAINKIQNKALHELVDPSLGYDSDYKVRKMVNAVAELAFQCLQSEKDMRPSMADALETLKAIQNDGNNKEKAEVMDIPADDVGLLKSGSLSMSPDTVTFSWTSTKTTTPNASS